MGPPGRDQSLRLPGQPRPAHDIQTNTGLLPERRGKVSFKSDLLLVRACISDKPLPITGDVFVTLTTLYQISITTVLVLSATITSDIPIY